MHKLKDSIIKNRNFVKDVQNKKKVKFKIQKSQKQNSVNDIKRHSTQ